MKKIILSFVALGAMFSLQAQNSISEALSAIEQNNTTLKALRESAEAEKLDNRTGIYLNDPEAEFGYLWGTPGAIGNRVDISVSQTFDFPTLSGLKSKVANGKNDLVEWQYKADRMNVLLEAEQYCIDLVYYNAQIRELNYRYDIAKSLSEMEQKRLALGESNAMENNNVKLNLATAEAKIKELNVERNAVIAQLTRLNGGNPINITQDSFTPIAMPETFDEWYATAEDKNPALAYVKKEVELSKNQVSLSKSMGLPTFSAGYMSEKVVGEHYQGVTVGLSIPLWSNRNRVKQAKTAQKAAELRALDAKQQFYGQLYVQYQRALGLKELSQSLNKSLDTVNNSKLLRKALDEGQISVHNYLTDVAIYYDAIDQALAAERDYQKAYADLTSIDL
jgi:outer membrane protein TolC